MDDAFNRQQADLIITHIKRNGIHLNESEARGQILAAIELAAIRENEACEQLHRNYVKAWSEAALEMPLQAYANRVIENHADQIAARRKNRRGT